MGKTARLEPDCDAMDAEFYSDSEFEQEFEEPSYHELHSYLKSSDDESENAAGGGSDFDGSEHHGLPADWEDFDFSHDDWDAA